MKPVLIIKTGDSLPGLKPLHGDFEDWFVEGMGTDHHYQVVAVHEGQTLPSVTDVQAVVITGSPHMVSQRKPWSEATAGWLRAAVTTALPVLGVCYGHQLLAHALGGVVGPNPNGRQIGTVKVRLTEQGNSDPLLGGFSSEQWFQTTHVESVLSLPEQAVVLGSTEMDPHHAFRVGERIWGLQFHPEFGDEVLRGYIRTRRDDIAAEGLDPERLLQSVKPTPAGDIVLRRFAGLLQQGDRHQPSAA